MMFRTLAAAIACAALAALPAAAQGYKAPRNMWGQPDLSGVWTNATITRLERDPKFGERLALTEAEAAELEGATAANFAKSNAPTTRADTKADELPACPSGATGPACGYNMFWVDPGTKVMRVNGQPRASIIVEPKNGQLPLRPEASARLRSRFGNAQVGNFDGPERRPHAERCLVAFGSSSGPPMLPVLYNNHYQIMQNRNEVMILVEMVHDARIIRLNGQHEPPHVKKWMGDSIGRWEGDTLVVETTNFHPSTSFRGASANLTVTEKFTRVGKDRLLYQFTVKDPTVWAEPWSGEYEFSPTGGEVYEYACHEGNYALEGILSAARAEDRAAAAGGGATAGR